MTTPVKEYTVTWTIQADAKSPEAAAETVFNEYFRTDHDASFFIVSDVTLPDSSPKLIDVSVNYL